MRGGNVNVFGTDYMIRVKTEEQEPKLKECDANGLAELYAKEIIIRTGYENEPTVYKNVEEFKLKVLRHELFHAIFHELGHDDYCEDEKLVNMLAVTYPKIEEIMQRAKRYAGPSVHELDNWEKA